MINRGVALAVACAVGVAGCSSKPRNFAPMLAAPPADAEAYEARWLDCREQVAQATDQRANRGVSAAGGVAAGAGAGVATGAAVSGATYGTMAAAAAAAAAALAVVPVAGLAGAWGISKMKKTKKERAIKAATAECLARSGYAVERWRVLSKKEVRALAAAKAGKEGLSATAGDPAQPAATPKPD